MMYQKAVQICPLCKTAVGDEDYKIVCRDCGKTYHEECWDANEGCATPLCSQNHKEDAQYIRQSANWAIGSGAVIPTPNVDFIAFPDKKKNIEPSPETPRSFYTPVSPQDVTPIQPPVMPPMQNNNYYPNTPLYDGGSGNMYPNSGDVYVDNANSPNDFYAPSPDIITPPAEMISPPQKPTPSIKLSYLKKDPSPPREVITPQNFVPQPEILIPPQKSAPKPTPKPPAPTPKNESAGSPNISSGGSDVKKPQKKTVPQSEILKPPKNMVTPSEVKSEPKIEGTEQNNKKSNSIIAALVAVVIVAVIGFAIATSAPPKVKDISFKESSITISVNDREQPEYTVNPPKSAKNGEKWKSSDETVAVVENGVIKGIDEGECDITLTIGGKSVAEHVIVVPAVESIVVEDNNIDMVIGDKTVIPYKIFPAKASETDVTIISSDENIVSVDGAYVKAISKGECVVTIVAGKKRENINVRVFPDIISISFAETSCEMRVGDKKKIEYIIAPPDSQDFNLKFTSSNEDVAIVENGEIIAVGSGKCEISAEGGEVVKKLNVSVEAVVEKINLSETTLGMYVGDTKSIICSVEPKNASGYKVEWSSSNSEVAEVDNSGNIKAVGEGKARITVTADNGKATVDIMVSSAETKQANEKFAGTWRGRLAYSSKDDHMEKISSERALFIAYKNNTCSLLLDSETYTGTWVYDSREKCYITSLNDNINTFSQIQDVADLKGALMMVFQDGTGTPIEPSVTIHTLT